MMVAIRRQSYALADSPLEAEEERLSLLEQIADPHTTQRLEALGVGPGSDCLEVGAGHGAVARWMAERVAPSGRVVAADRDTRFLDSLEIKTMEVRRHDVGMQDFEPDRYDLVHSRSFLMHFTEPQAILARMLRAVRPGGWLYLEEGDCGAFGAVDPSYPGASEFDRSVRAFWDWMTQSRVMHMYFGRRISGMVERLGFDDWGVESYVMQGRGGGQLARLCSISMQVPALREMLVKGLVLSEQEIDHLVRMYEDPAFEFVGMMMFGAWARRPASGHQS